MLVLGKGGFSYMISLFFPSVPGGKGKTIGSGIDSTGGRVGTGIGRKVVGRTEGNGVVGTTGS